MEELVLKKKKMIQVQDFFFMVLNFLQPEHIVLKKLFEQESKQDILKNLEILILKDIGVTKQ